jgi:hypothetical protein
MDLMITVGKVSLGQLMQLIVALRYHGSQLAPSVECCAGCDEGHGVAQE